jgi:hypothetical protein
MILRDVVLRVPRQFWLRWICEGDLPGEEPTETWAFSVGAAPALPPGARCYVTAFGMLRGYAPISDTTGRTKGMRGGSFLRRGDAVAVTVPGLNLSAGRWAWAYRSWSREHEVPFPAWATAGLPPELEADVRLALDLRKNVEHRAILKERACRGATSAAELFAGLPEPTYTTDEIKALCMGLTFADVEALRGARTSPPMASKSPRVDTLIGMRLLRRYGRGRSSNVALTVLGSTVLHHLSTGAMAP